MNSTPSTEDYTARARLFGGNRMKLGVMAFNCSHGSTITTVPEAWQLNWPDTKDIAQAVDRSGMEALLPVGRWKGYGGPSNFNNCTFESFTWASAIGAADELLHRARHRACAAGASTDGGQDGGHDRSRHQRPFRHERGVRMVQERIRHVRRADASARRSLQIRHRMARVRAAGMDARTKSSISRARASTPSRSGASRSRCRSPIRRS